MECEIRIIEDLWAFDGGGGRKWNQTIAVVIVQCRKGSVEMTEESNAATWNWEHIFCMQYMNGIDIVSKLQKTFTLTSIANFETKKDFGSKKRVSCTFQEDNKTMCYFSVL